MKLDELNDSSDKREDEALRGQIEAEQAHFGHRHMDEAIEQLWMDNRSDLIEYGDQGEEDREGVG